VISNRCLIIACRSQVTSNNMSVVSTIDIATQENSTNTEDRYKYRKTVPIQETVRTQKIVLIQGIGMNTRKNNSVFKNRINTCFKLFTTIKERIIVELTSRQA